MRLRGISRVSFKSIASFSQNEEIFSFTPTMAEPPPPPLYDNNEEQAPHAAAYPPAPAAAVGAPIISQAHLPSPTSRKAAPPRQTDHTYHDWAKHPPDDYAIRSSKKADNNFVSASLFVSVSERVLCRIRSNVFVYTLVV
jgi:hypothetical protein